MISRTSFEIIESFFFIFSKLPSSNGVNCHGHGIDFGVE